VRYEILRARRADIQPENPEYPAEVFSPVSAEFIPTCNGHRKAIGRTVIH